MNNKTLRAINVADAQRTASGISATVTWSDGMVTPFHATADDAVDYGSELFRQLDAGEWGSVAEYTDAMRMTDTLITNTARMRMLEDEASAVTRPLAEEKDLGIISDSDLARYKAWAIYRQALRKVDLSVSEPDWPTKPK